MTAALTGVLWATDRPVPLNATGDLDTAPGVYGIDGPDVCRDACPLAGTEHNEDQCAAGPPHCVVCQGAGGWQQHDGLIVECPRGCMADGGQR